MLIDGKRKGVLFSHDDDEYDEKEIKTFEECFNKRDGSIKIAKVLSNADDSVFEKVKKTILAPDMRLKETCQRLSGLLPMIEVLNKVSKRPSVFAPFLSGPDGELIEKDDKDSALIWFLASEISRRVKEVFGEPDFSRPIRRGDDLEGESSHEDSSEEIHGSDRGEDNGGFDDDFCVNFSRTNAFASF